MRKLIKLAITLVLVVALGISFMQYAWLLVAGLVIGLPIYGMIRQRLQDGKIASKLAWKFMRRVMKSTGFFTVMLLVVMAITNHQTIVMDLVSTVAVIATWEGIRHIKKTQTLPSFWGATKLAFQRG